MAYLRSNEKCQGKPKTAEFVLNSAHPLYWGREGEKGDNIADLMSADFKRPAWLDIDQSTRVTTPASILAICKWHTFFIKADFSSEYRISKR